jgi:uncharacterized alkaline shock family protein YloU
MQNQIIKNIFLKATTNIETLALMDETIRDTMEKLINDEADRLLILYLNEKH